MRSKVRKYFFPPFPICRFEQHKEISVSQKEAREILPRATFISWQWKLVAASFQRRHQNFWTFIWRIVKPHSAFSCCANREETCATGDRFVHVLLLICRTVCKIICPFKNFPHWEQFDAQGTGVSSYSQPPCHEALIPLPKISLAQFRCV